MVRYLFPMRKDRDMDDSTSGSGSFPWMEHSDGVCIFGLLADDWTLAHEIGHWLGLYHVFDADDMVEDTGRVEKGTTDNVMDYTARTPTVTPGQLERMRRFLHAEPRSRTWKEPLS